MQLLNCDSGRVLAIGAHPDDIELSCSGSLIKLKKEFGCKLFEVICTNGEFKSDFLIRIREQKKAAKAIGVEEVFYLKLKDGFLRHDADLVSKIEKVIDIVKPDIVFTHCPEDYHQDHIAVSKATISAVRRRRVILLFYPSYVAPKSFYFNLYVDITKYFNKKIEILNIFKSQSRSWYMDRNFIEIKEREAGFYIGCQYAEKFFIYFSSL